MDPTGAYPEQITRILRDLGIPESYGADRCLRLFHQPAELVSVGLDIYDREIQLTPAAAEAWRGQRNAAAQSGITLQLVSGYRSPEYQRQIILRKLAKGLSMEDILQSSAAPGYSEHHTGNAVDITTPGFKPLVQDFAQSPAYHWLQNHAHSHGFHLSFPPGNPHGIVFEPWHWCHRPKPPETPA